MMVRSATCDMAVTDIQCCLIKTRIRPTPPSASIQTKHPTNPYPPLCPVFDRARALGSNL